MKLAKSLVIGVGNLFRSEDAIGIRLAQELQKTKNPLFEVTIAPPDISQLLSLWSGYNKVILIDAMKCDSKNKGIQVFYAHEKPLPSFFEQTSTHGFGPHECIELARSLGELPPFLAVIGVPTNNYEFGEMQKDDVLSLLPSVSTTITELTKGTLHA